MKWLPFLIMITSCADAQVKINLYSKKVMDIELPSKNIIPHCTIPRDPEKKNSWLGFYIFYNNRIEWVGERRQQLPLDCEKDKHEIIALLRKVAKARVIGIESSENKGDRDLAVILQDPKIKTIEGRWQLSRLMTDKGCFGWEGCEEPKLIEKDRYRNIYE